jgi:hypothetical protein
VQQLTERALKQHQALREKLALVERQLTEREAGGPKNKSFEDYANDPAIKELCNNDPEKIKKANQSYLQMEKNRRKAQAYGGNPRTMV